MSRRRPTRGNTAIAGSSNECTPLHSDSDSESSTLRGKKSRCFSEVKSSHAVCTKLGLKDVELDWTEADYQNLTTFSIFVRMTRPQLTAANPRTSPAKLTRVLEAKWREFQHSNPFNKKQEHEQEEQEQEHEQEEQDGDTTDNSKSSTECDEETNESQVGGASLVNDSQEDEQEEPSKSKPKATLRIKLSLKPLRKSSRERKTTKTIMTDQEFNKLLDDEVGSESDSMYSDRKHSAAHTKRKKHDSDSGDVYLSSSGGETTRRCRNRKKRRVNQSGAMDSGDELESRPVTESDEDDLGSSDSDTGHSKKKKSRPVIPGERKSSRSRKGPTSMQELSDREFEKLLKEQEQEKEREKNSRRTAREMRRPHSSTKSHVVRSAGDAADSEATDDDNPKCDKIESKAGGESGNESDHIWYCEMCKDGGDLLLCDTCPKSFHKECLKLEIVPDGEWSCPLCTGEGLPEKGDTSEEDDHDTFCRVCRDGGDVILCDFCPLVYHMNCLDPPLKNLPDGDWKCPVCVVKEQPLKAKVKQILTWRWKHQPKNTDELDHTHSPSKQSVSKAKDDDSTECKTATTTTTMTTTVVLSKDQRMKGAERELFVKYEFHSYWDCDWIPELQLEVQQPFLHIQFKRKFDLDEPPALDDGSSFGRPRHKANTSEDDPHNLEEKYYRYGIKPEWMQIHRILTHDGNGRDRRYLVKWRDLTYAECTWEFPEDVPEGLEDWDKRLEEYWSRRKLKTKEDREHKKSELPKKSLLRKKLEVQPEYLDANGGKLHPYQLEGLNWLRFSWSQGTNTILADEMGLGKTIQCITFLYGLWKEGYATKPFLISAPLSTVTNWEREFEFWAPELYVVTYVGQRDSRVVIREREFSYRDGAFAYTQKPCKMREGYRPKFDVLLTSYEFVNVDSTTFASIEWDILVIDEAHRLKNNQSLFFRTLSEYKIKSKLLLTGTPLQNNLEELFNLLNFLEPGKFSQMDEFLNEFSEISKDEQVLKLHNMLAPHMLRRMKSDVLKDIPSKSEFIVRVELSPMQKKYYKHILTKNYEALNAKGYSNQTSLMNIMMDLRKCCNHPYLFPGAEKDAPLNAVGNYEGSAMTKACGKLELLAKMLKILKRDGHRVLIFSQMTRVLDVLEDFLAYHQYGYERIDGSIAGNKRQESIDRFNSASSTQFVFLLSTRAGGLGINLATADTVVIYDMDWNPHNDIQAFSRAHRIGQRNKVMIYRFVSRNTVEEKIAQVCKKKMMLSELIVHRGMGGGANIASNEKKESLTKQEIGDILKHGAENLFKDDKEGEVVWEDEDVEKLLDRNQEGQEEKEKEFGMNEYLRSFKVASYQVKEGVDEEEEQMDEDKDDDSNDATSTAAAAATDEDKDGRRANETDMQYWQRVLGPAYNEHVIQTLKEQEEIAKTLGKGKRIRKQINYAEREMMLEANGSKKKKASEEDAAAVSDYEPTSESSDESSAGEEGGADEDPIAKKQRKLQQKASLQPPKPIVVALPPLVERTDGQVLVLGFTARQRRAFLDAIMRYGMPPEDPYRSQWLVRDLRAKPERIFKAYVSLFMRHLCEPIADNADKFADGVPREGLSRQHVLTRIGIIALIRKKVHEFEELNGVDSMTQFRTKLTPNTLTNNSTHCKDELTTAVTEAESKHNDKLMTEVDKTDVEMLAAVKMSDKDGMDIVESDKVETVDTVASAAKKDSAAGVDVDAVETVVTAASPVKKDSAEGVDVDTVDTAASTAKKDSAAGVDVDAVETVDTAASAAKKDSAVGVDVDTVDTVDTAASAAKKDSAAGVDVDAVETVDTAASTAKKDSAAGVDVDAVETVDTAASAAKKDSAVGVDVDTVDTVDTAASAAKKDSAAGVDVDAVETVYTAASAAKKDSTVGVDVDTVSVVESDKVMHVDTVETMDTATSAVKKDSATVADVDIIQAMDTVSVVAKDRQKVDVDVVDSEVAVELNSVDEQKQTQVSDNNKDAANSATRDKSDTQHLAAVCTHNVPAADTENIELKTNIQNKLSADEPQQQEAMETGHQPQQQEAMDTGHQPQQQEAMETGKQSDEQKEVIESAVNEKDVVKDGEDKGKIGTEKERTNKEVEIDNKQGRFSTSDQLRRLFYIADGGFTELHTLWQLEEQQMSCGKEYETWFRLHDFWLLAGVVTHGYRHWQDILCDQRFDVLNHAFKTENERARKAAFLNRRFQLLEQALVIEEQLRKSLSENSALIADQTVLLTDDKFRGLDELALSLKNQATSTTDVRQTKNPKLQKVLTQVVALVNDINDASYTNMPASLAHGYTQLAPKPIIPRVVTQKPQQWSYKPTATSVHQPTPANIPAHELVIAPTTAAKTDSSDSKTKDVICID